MCRLVSCSKCGKPTWAGCGAHIEMVMSGVPKEARCKCNEPKTAPQPPPASPGKPR